MSIADEEDQLNNITEGYAEYQSNDMLLTVLCGSLLYTTLCKVLFNACQKGGRDVKVPYDLWTITDIFAAVYTMITFTVIVAKPPVDYLEADSKDYYDYLVSGLIVIQWLRFYVFFLMIKELSQMILTFIKMVIDTLAFLLLTICYLIIVAAIFTTLF